MKRALQHRHPQGASPTMKSSPQKSALCAVLVLSSMIFISVPVTSALSVPSSVSMPMVSPSDTKDPTIPTTSSSDNTVFKAEMRAKIAQSVAKGERRAAERSANGRETCPSCYRPPTLCLCKVLKATEPSGSNKLQTKLLILQHPNERRKNNLSTVPLLKLALKDQVKIVGGHTFEQDDMPPIFQETIDKGVRPLLLYPSPDSISLDADIFRGKDASIDRATDEITSIVSHHRDVINQSNNNLLIVIDGTWSEAKRMVRDSPFLTQNCQPVQFSSDALSIYHALRREPEEHCLSTLEACAQTLMLLEPPSSADHTQRVVDRLHTVLQAHVDAHLANAQRFTLSRENAAAAALLAKNQRKLEIEQIMFPNMTYPVSSTIIPSVDKENSDNGSLQPKENQEANITLLDGSILRPLRPSDAPLVNAWWEYSSERTLPLVMRRIALSQSATSDSSGRQDRPGCFGIEENETGQLVACIVRYEGGALGMLHVLEHFRRRGYGLALLQHATKILHSRGEERVAFIYDGNDASEKLFLAAGWERADPQIKRKTGARKAKRKWIHR